MGLEEGKEYKSTENLRYRGIIIVTDADHDGSHIKGLLVNWLHYSWPSLLKIKGFLKYMRTPIIKASKGKDSIDFYNTTDYDNWKNSTDLVNKWKIKYYKGLGTSTSSEAKEYFKKLSKHMVDFGWEDNHTENNAIELAFSKQRANDRKLWLEDYNPDNIIDNKEKTVNYSNFINNELILFSMSDVIRSIPSIVDGLKPSQRKTIYCALKKPLSREMKVAQFSGYVSSESGYHHGEASLMGVLISQAQNYVGSSNINYLKPNGQFGSRLNAGKDAASPRYIFIELEDITSIIFNKEDSKILNYLNDDGFMIEPEYYVPVVPMILINGSTGIGTGFSTTIPQFNPKDIVKNIKRLMDGKEQVEMIPYYAGFKGSIIKDSKNTYTCYGKIKRINKKVIEIYELPVIGKERSTYEYTDFLNTIIVESKSDKDYNSRWITGYKNYSTDNIVRFHVEFVSELVLFKMLKDMETFYKKMKLSKSFNTNNMHLFNERGTIQKYDTVDEILNDYYKVRYKFYIKRRDNIINILEKELLKLNSQVKFIENVMSKKIKVFMEKEENIISNLEKNEYPRVINNAGIETYDYLLDIKTRDYTDNKVTQLKNRRDQKNSDLENMKEKTPEDLWKDDLSEFMTSYTKMENKI